jgi:cytochrome c biogenesis protein ResB
VTTKNLLSNLLGFMGIDKSDCVMVAAQNVKRLPNTCTPFQDHVNATLDLTYDKNGMMDTFKWSINNIDSIRNKTAFSKLDANHPFKVFVEKVYANHTKYKKFRHYLSSQLSLHNINGKETDINKVKHPLIHKIVRKIGTYQWDDDLVLEIMSNLK